MKLWHIVAGSIITFLLLTAFGAMVARCEDNSGVLAHNVETTSLYRIDTTKLCLGGHSFIRTIVVPTGGGAVSVSMVQVIAGSNGAPEKCGR